MKRLLWPAAAAALLACGGTPSTFDFTLSGDLSERVASDRGVTGEIDNTGRLALDDGTWLLSMTLNGLQAGVDQPAGELEVVDRATGDLFSTTIGGTCNVKLDPHGSNNGDLVHGVFHCTGLTSSDGRQVDIGFGEFWTSINDAANDPNLNPPHP
jgi:hypothetical protein